MQAYKEKYSSYEGHETWTNALRMQIKMHLRIAFMLLLAFTILAAVYIHATAEQHGIAITAHNLLYVLSYGQKNHYLRLFVAVILFYPVAWWFFRGRARNQSNRRYIRGARLMTTDQFYKQVREHNQKTCLPFGTISMPVDLENRTTMIMGKPGVGKSQCFRKILKQILKGKGQGIVYDHKGEYLTEFFDPNRDLIFNPLDSRSLGWNVFNDLQTYMDVDAQAASLIPPSISTTNDPFWNDAARGVYSGCLHYLYQNDYKNNAQLWRMLIAEPRELAGNLARTRGGEAGYRYITQNVENSRQAESVLAVMMQYTKCFEYMANTDGDFSINDWLKNGSGMIYITNYEDVEETLRPILSLFIDLVGRKLLSMADDLDRRIYLLLDEFGSLQRMSSIIKMVTKGRSKGAATFIGIQDDGQMEKTYGRQLLRTLDNAPGNRITFALSGETAEREVKYNIGETEFMEIERSQSMGPNDMRDGVSIREHKKRELLFLPSDIANLPDLTGIVKLRGYDFVMSHWTYEQPKKNHSTFALREDLILENIVAQQQRLREQVEQIDIQFTDIEE
jgi:type IV secretory pathway TraG/TraD family ATPase VirD4